MFLRKTSYHWYESEVTQAITYDTGADTGHFLNVFSFGEYLCNLLFTIRFHQQCINLCNRTNAIFSVFLPTA